jgi:hypothetical protein
VSLQGGGTTGNLVEGNTIGLTPSGSSPLPNTWGGELNLGTGNDTFTLNTIGGNTDGGLLLNGKGTSNNLVQGNFIGTDAGGDGGLGNGGDGIVISGGGTLNLVGGGTAGDGNVISGNGAYGVLLTGAGTGENTLQGNTIGTTPSSSAALPNQWGVGIQHGAVNDTFTVNTVSGNTDGGFLLNGTGTSGNVLHGNTIGLGAAGAALGNGGDGVTVEGGATLNTIGGSAGGQGNKLGFNLGGGVLLSGSTTTGDALLSNLIFSSGPNRSGPGITLANGANGRTGAPVIDSITTSGGVTTITGTSAPSATVQTFGNGSCSDPEGKSLLGTTHADGSGNWKLVPVKAVPSGTGVTATQTTANSDSSSFSACVSAP